MPGDHAYCQRSTYDQEIPHDLKTILCDVLHTMTTLSFSLRAACMSDTEVTALLVSYTAKTPAANPEGLSETDVVTVNYAGLPGAKPVTVSFK